MLIRLPISAMLFLMHSATKNEVLAIIDTLEGMLRLSWTAALLAERTKWCAVLAKMEGR